jgi:uncharacterized membrane protein
LTDDAKQGPQAPEPERGEVVSAEVSEFQVAGELVQRSVTYHSGPLPPPEDLRQYEQILPGFTDRVLSLTERESEHRMNEERFQNRAMITLARRGQWLASLVVLALIGVGGAGILTGHSVGGLVAIAAGVASIVTAFVAPEIFASLRRRTIARRGKDQRQLPEPADEESGGEE